MATKQAAHPPQVDALDSFVKLANTYPQQAIQIMFWKARHQNPEFTLEITPEDLKGFGDCIDYLDVKPEIRIYRPQGLPAQDPIPAQGNRRAVPGRAAQPPKNYVVVQMVDADGNAFVPIENNERDQDRGKEAQRIVRLREEAPRLANQLLNDIRIGTLSNSTIQEAAEALKVLAGA